MADGFTVEVFGDKELIRKLDRLGSTAARKLARPAVARAIVPVNKAAKRKAPVETGLLKKSIGRKMKTYGRAGVVWAGVGPKQGFAGVGPDGRKRDPVNYAHLVELGTTHSPAQPFLRPALDTQKPAAMRILTREIRKRLEREAKKP